MMTNMVFGCNETKCIHYDNSFNDRCSLLKFQGMPCKFRFVESDIVEEVIESSGEVVEENV